MSFTMYYVRPEAHNHDDSDKNSFNLGVQWNFSANGEQEETAWNFSSKMLTRHRFQINVNSSI